MWFVERCGGGVVVGAVGGTGVAAFAVRMGSVGLMVDRVQVASVCVGLTRAGLLFVDSLTLVPVQALKMIDRAVACLAVRALQLLFFLMADEWQSLLALVCGRGRSRLLCL
jgi:hypothetical protein